MFLEPHHILLSYPEVKLVSLPLYHIQEHLQRYDIGLHFIPKHMAEPGDYLGVFLPWLLGKPLFGSGNPFAAVGVTRVHKSYDFERV